MFLRQKGYLLIAFCQICLGCAKFEVEVNADRHVTSVIGDVEAEEFFVFVFLFVVEEGEDETVVGLFVVGFPIFLTAIDERLGFHFFASCHRKMDALSNLVVSGVERAGEGEDGEHVVVAVRGLVVMFRPLAISVEEVLLHMALAFGVGVPHLIDSVVFAFEGAFAEVEGYELWGDVGDEGVAHGEDSVASFVAGKEQVVAQSGLSLVSG